MLRRTVDVIAMRMLVGGIDRHRREALIYGSMVHGTATSIGGIRSADLCELLYNHVPPSSPEDLTSWIHVPDPDARRELYVRMTTTLVGEDTALALLSLTDLGSDGGRIRPKYHSDREVPLLALVAQALQFVNSWAECEKDRSGYYAPIR